MAPPLKLTNFVSLFNKAYLLYTDNWYTSIPLLVKLNQRGIHLCGTVKSRIRGTPKDFQLKQKEQPRGTMRQVTSNFNGVRMYYTSWQDSKVV